MQYGAECNVTDTSVDALKFEPMLFCVSKNFAEHNGGPIADAFLDALSDEFLNNDSLIIDSRTHMLMPNFFPCIPGWHHDDVARTRIDNQPDYKQGESDGVKHAMLLVNGDVAPTEFALGEAYFEPVPLYKKVYKEWHDAVEDRIELGVLERVSHDGSMRIVYFDDRTWHRGTAARKAGWRHFIRASINTDRKHQNEIRPQVQAYINLEQEGW